MLAAAAARCLTTLVSPSSALALVPAALPTLSALLKEHSPLLSPQHFALAMLRLLLLHLHEVSLMF